MRSSAPQAKELKEPREDHVRTRSTVYADVAHAIGVPLAPPPARRSRADNPTLLVILAIVSSGRTALGGYALGAERKAAFLPAEGVRELLPL